MRTFLCLTVLFSSGLWGQKPADPMTTPPETVIGIVDGVKVTAGELSYVVTTSMAELQKTLRNDPMELLRYYGFMKRLSEMAESAKLDRESPQSERLRINRMQILAEAQLNAQMAAITVLAEEQKKHYEEHRSRYAMAKVKVIYLPFMANPPQTSAPGARKIMSENAAKSLAEKLAKDLRAGADFVRLVKQHSEHAESAAKDGDFGTIRGSDNYPPEIKTAVLGAKPGAIVGPVRLGNGFYIFRVDESVVRPYDEVKDEIYNELKDRRWREWMDKVRTGIDIQLP